jgi:hypothetical protein
MARMDPATYFNISSHFFKSTVSLHSKSIHDGAYSHLSMHFNSTSVTENPHNVRQQAAPSTGTSITENAVSQNHVISTSRRTEYSWTQVPLENVCHQLAPASMTIQLDQNHMLFTSKRNRLFLDVGTFHCKSVTTQLIQNHVLLTSKRNRIFLEAGAFIHCSSSTGTRVGDNSVRSKSHATY